MKSRFEGTPSTDLLNGLAAYCGVFPEPVKDDALADCFISAATPVYDMVNTIYHKRLAEKIASWRSNERVILINPSVGLSRHFKRLNVRVVVVLSSYNHDHRCQRAMAGDTLTTRAVQAWNLRKEVLPVDDEDLALYCSVDELAYTIEQRGVMAHCVVSEDVCRQVSDVIWSDIANRLSIASGLDTMILHMDCMPSEIMAVTQIKKAEPYQSRNYTINANFNRDVVDKVGQMHVTSLFKSSIECTYKSEFCSSSILTRAPVASWLEKVYSGTNDGIMSSSGSRRVTSRIGPWVVLEEQYSVVARRDPINYSVIDDFKMVGLVDTRLRKLLGYSCDSLSIVVPEKLVQTMMSVSTSVDEITHDNTTLRIRRKTELEQRSEINAILSMRLATIKLFDTTAEQLIQAMRPAVSRAFLESVVVMLMELSRSGERYGPLATVSKWYIRLKTWWNPRSVYSSWLSDSISFGSHVGAPLTGLAYDFAYNPFVGKTVLEQKVIVPRTMNAVINHNNTVNCIARALQKFGLVCGDWDCVYVAVQKAGFLVDEEFMRERAAPLSVEGMYNVFDGICEFADCKFVIYKNGAEARVCGAEDAPVIYHFVLTEQPLHIVFTKKKHTRFLGNLFLGRKDVTLFFDIQEVRDNRKLLNASLMSSTIETLVKEGRGLDSILSEIKTDAYVSVLKSTKKQRRFRFIQDHLEGPYH